jgi:hypothetical protein
MAEVPADITLRDVTAIIDSERLEPYLRLYDAFVETTTQMLATPKLNERLLLALEGVETIFGLQQAAIAIISERDAELTVRAAVGFEGDSISSIEMPLDSSAACVRVIHDAQPVWISIEEDEASRTLFDKMNWKQDVLALPLFGSSELPTKNGRGLAGASRLSPSYWSFEPGSRLGVLYVGATENEIDPMALNLLQRFAVRLGIIASHAIHQERLVATVTKLQRERQWMESIMKSLSMTTAAFRPGPPEIEPPGWVVEPVW